MIKYSSNLYCLILCLLSGIVNADQLRPQPAAGFGPPEWASIPIVGISGQLRVRFRSEPPYMKIIKDRYKSARTEEFRLMNLPDMNFSFFSIGGAVIPKPRGVNKSTHPYWEWLVAPGKIWPLPENAGNRIVIPFALQEKNANCTHNGWLKIDLDGDGKVSDSFLQISSETCVYLQFDLAEKPLVEFVAGTNSVLQEQQKVWEHEQLGRIPVFDHEELLADFPKLRIEKLLRPYIKESSTSGLFINGKHYRLNCMTRAGENPYCGQLALPSYSTAKSMFASLALMRLEARHPGIRQTLVSELISECDSQSWKGVTLQHLLDMRTGLYKSRKYHVDEGGKKMIGFFQTESGVEKLNLACGMWPRRSEPGKYFVYHSSDTYLAGLMMQRLFRKLENNQDIYRDWFANDLWKNLNLSPLLNDSKRTYDEQQQVFAGYGLTYLIDDVYKIVRYIYSQAKSLDPELQRDMLFAALQAGNDPANRLPYDSTIAYKTGFWSLDVSQALGCRSPRWIPFMSGYGGITVALIAPNVMYYNYADDNRYLWLQIVQELGRQIKLCPE